MEPKGASMVTVEWSSIPRCTLIVYLLCYTSLPHPCSSTHCPTRFLFRPTTAKPLSGRPGAAQVPVLLLQDNGGARGRANGVGCCCCFVVIMIIVIIVIVVIIV